MKYYVNYLRAAFVSLLLFSCTNDPCREETGTFSELGKTEMNAGSTVSLDCALAELDAVLDDIYPSTRGRKRYSVANISVCGGHNTRSEDGSLLPDTLVYVVNFDNSEGFAVLGGQDYLDPVYAVTESGSLDADRLGDYVASGYDILHDIYIHGDDDECYCGYVGDDDEHDCPFEEGEEDDLPFVDDPDLPMSLTGNSILSDLLNRPGTEMVDIHLGQDSRPVTPTRRIVHGEWEPDVKVGPLLETEWHQNYPFDNLCPTGCPAGCVVIAVAQIMAYHELPKNPRFNDVPCDWQQMKDSNNLTSREIAIQYASMCKELGSKANCNVDYDPGGSSSNARKAKRTLGNYGFRNLKKRTGFNEKNQRRALGMLDAGKPVYLGASGKRYAEDGSVSNSGHAFVLDGYVKRYYEKTESLFYATGDIDVYKSRSKHQTLVHINWGWGSDAYNNKKGRNGYFVLKDSSNTNEGYKKWEKDSLLAKKPYYYDYFRYFRMITYDI